jgi:hypothetical protein
METMTVDDYIETKVLPEFHPVVAMIRGLMKEYKPEVKETISYGMPCFQMKNILAYITPNKKGITFSFVHGVEFEDKYGLLRGKAKWARYVQIRKVAEANQEALRYYINQAVALDAVAYNAS